MSTLHLIFLVPIGLLALVYAVAAVIGLCHVAAAVVRDNLA